MKILEMLIVPIGVLSLLTVYYTLGGVAVLCLAIGLCVGSIMEKLDLNRREIKGASSFIHAKYGN